MKLKSNNLLGKTGLRVPSIIYGTSYLGNLYTELSYNEKLALMRKWFECTETPVVIDSAGKYGAGLALEIINKGLTDLDIRPEDIIISNKLGWYRVPLETDEPVFEPGAWANLENDAIQLFGYQGIMDCYQQGNQLLGDKFRAQLVSAHDPDEYLHAAEGEQDRETRYTEILESYRAMFELKEQGKVKAVGIGSKDWTIIRELYNDVKFDWVMFANSFTIYNHPSELLEFMDQLYTEGVGIINSALFHGGFLTGGSKFDYQDVDRHSELGIKIYSWRDLFNMICKKHNILPADACLHFGISHPAIASMALNTSRPEKMNHNVEMLLKEIPNDFWKEMKDKGLIDKEYTYL
jgi:D-threo-aldose 1-dehydrogenase